MKQKKIEVLYAVDNLDNTKTTLFAIDGKATKEIIKEAIINYYPDYLDDKELLEVKVEEIFRFGECSLGSDEFFFDETTLIYEV